MPAPLPIPLSLGERTRELRGPADVGAQLGGAPAGVEPSRGTAELLGSNWEFGKSFLPASRPAACLVLAHVRPEFMREGKAKGGPRLLPLSSTVSLGEGLHLSLCVTDTHEAVP